MELERQNPHWEEGYFYKYEKKRFAFSSIKKSAFSGLITLIYGLRRVGKSVLLKQMINEMINGGTKRADILYFSFDEETSDFWDVIKEYEKKIGRRVSSSNIVVLDEIQKIHDWRGKVKGLYDSSGAKIMLSGSNSSMLRKGSESLAGRINEFVLSELSFEEFLYFRGKTPSPMLEESIENEFWEYIRRPFPELALKESLEPSDYTDSISRKIIFEDLPSVFPIDEPQLLHRLFSIVCTNPGLLVEYNSLASDLGRNRKTISSYMDYLLHGFLVWQVFNYSKNQLTSEKRLKKFYPSLACFAKGDQSKTVETATAQTLRAKFFWNYKNRYEVDFILTEPFYAFEVKYQERLSDDDFRGLDQFAAEYNGARTCMVSKRGTDRSIPYYMLWDFLKKNDVRISTRFEEHLD